MEKQKNEGKVVESLEKRMNFVGFLGASGVSSPPILPLFLKREML
jgi:hypothetical protein